MCVPLNSAVLFEVSGSSYPVYLKDSILNTNLDFDYGPFLNLAKMVNQNVDVQAYSYIFDQEGIYVFVDAGNTDKVTVIGVVGENEQCSDVDSNVKQATV